MLNINHVNWLSAHNNVEKVESIAPVEKVSTDLETNTQNEKFREPEGNEYFSNGLSDYKKEQLQKIIEESNRQLNGKDVKMEFKIHETTHKTMITLVDTETDEIVKEIPSEKMLDSIANIWKMVGIIVNKEG